MQHEFGLLNEKPDALKFFVCPKNSRCCCVVIASVGMARWNRPRPEGGRGAA